MHKRLLIVVPATAAVLAGALGGSAPARPAAQAAAAKRITGEGVGPIKLGASYAKLRERGLVGKARDGCELASPPPRGARLKNGYHGVVTISRKGRINNIVVTRGAKARGVGVGSTLEEVTTAFPKAKVDHSLEPTFLLTLVKVRENEGGPFIFGVEQETGKTSSIGIPFIPTCE